MNRYIGASRRPWNRNSKNDFSNGHATPAPESPRQNHQAERVERVANEKYRPVPIRRSLQITAPIVIESSRSRAERTRQMPV